VRLGVLLLNDGAYPPTPGAQGLDHSCASMYVMMGERASISSSGPGPLRKGRVLLVSARHPRAEVKTALTKKTARGAEVET
jgi:hypothetical protein